MKSRQKKSSLGKYIIIGCCLLFIFVALWWRRSNVLFRKTQATFINAVTQVTEKMRAYPELDLTFLSGDLTLLPRKVYESPNVYIAALKKEFATAVDSYNATAEFALPRELDIGEFTKSLALEQKVAQLFLF